MRVLKKLFLGDVVAKGTTRQLRKLTTEEPVMGGLFDADDNLVASWGTLVNTYGMDVEKDYTSSTYKTDTASPYYVLTNYTDLANGTKLVIDDSVTRIGEYAFRDCNSLTSITIPDSVTRIGMYAVYNCTSLKSVVIGDSVTSIGFEAFYNCSSLKSVVIGDSVTSISIHAFSGCKSLTSITIPDSVTVINDCAFYNCSSLKSVVIGDSVTRIGKYAFSDCNSLTSINYGGTITQWSAINLDQKWNSNVPATYVQCTDGTVTL